MNNTDSNLNNNSNKRNRLFERYSENIKLICQLHNWTIGYENNDQEFVEISDPYICPLCSKLFVRGYINQKHNNPLTLEDVPPKKMGGTPLILTCKNCNNKSGTRLDSKLFWKLNIEDFLKMKPNSSIDASFKINNRTTSNGKLIYQSEDHFGIMLNSNQNLNLEKEVTSTNKFNVNVRFQLPNEKLVKIGLLRIAYLQMITTFGFGYYFNKSSQIVRRQLMEPFNEIIKDFGVPIFNELTDDKIGIHFVNNPSKLRSFLVVFKLKRNNVSQLYSVIIPGPSEDCVLVYSKLKDIKQIKIDFTKVPDIDYFSEMNNVLGYNKIWNYYEPK